VIGSPADLNLGARLERPPDLFELRLDWLVGALDQVERKISRLPAPIVITARHPLEGGTNKLSARRRRELLFRFLSHARYVDVELRSVPVFLPLLEQAQRQKVRRIISVHYLSSTPPSGVLRARAHLARAHGANIFKVATRTDTPAELARLINFVTKAEAGVAISAMGIGKLGAISRLLLACAGSALVYVSLGKSDIAGQMSLEQFRALGIAPGRLKR
jgi:3-dehydroquinate dehydratase-1